MTTEETSRAADGDNDETSSAVELTEPEITSDTAVSDPEADSTPVAPKRRAPYVLVGAIVLAVALVASAGLTAWLYFFQFRPDQQVDPAAQQSAVAAARDGTVAVLSYGPDSLDKDLANAKSRLTGQFLSYYSDFTDQVVRPAVEQKAVKTDAKVVRAAVSEMQPSNATVLVFVNQTTLSKDRPDPALAASSVLVKMTKVDGKWLISEFNPV
ncbi:MAG: twin-arginine translocation pathway signal [Mycobacterium sp.]